MLTLKSPMLLKDKSSDSKLVKGLNTPRVTKFNKLLARFRCFNCGTDWKALTSMNTSWFPFNLKVDSTFNLFKSVWSKVSKKLLPKSSARRLIRGSKIVAGSVRKRLPYKCK